MMTIVVITQELLSRPISDSPTGFLFVRSILFHDLLLLSMFPKSNTPHFSVVPDGYSGSTLSQFELTLSSVATTARPTWAPTPGPLDQEDGCLDAAPLPMPSSVIDSTSGANIYTVDTCGSAYGYSSSGLWYSVVGTGEFITASLCENSYFDTQLSVWTGSCAYLQCVAGNDDSCSLLSTVSWASTAGQNYFIYVRK